MSSRSTHPHAHTPTPVHTYTPALAPRALLLALRWRALSSTVLHTPLRFSGRDFRVYAWPHLYHTCRTPAPCTRRCGAHRAILPWMVTFRGLHFLTIYYTLWYLCAWRGSTVSFLQFGWPFFHLFRGRTATYALFRYSALPPCRLINARHPRADVGARATRPAPQKQHRACRTTVLAPPQTTQPHAAWRRRCDRLPSGFLPRYILLRPYDSGRDGRLRNGLQGDSSVVRLALWLWFARSCLGRHRYMNFK